ncbi:SLC13 family permease [Lacticaseibacillus baoqingensis]|uniref:SLC13 family permease n=1 Tax=Lacticaseibacillus baoqingensis TaxID=2486013 RepID=A0ABW4E527_9LACO|nr:SLC13 family permease [Lacticaseibacillus baoqingensis]
MSYLALVGFAMMIIITVLLLKKKVSTIFCFTVIPVVAALLVGANLAQIGGYVSKGILKTYEIALLMLFSLPYFSMQSDTGMFDYIVKFILKRVKVAAPVLTALTVIIACVCELDGSVLSVYLITIPLLLPLYKKFHVDTRIMPFLCSVSILLMCNTPWNPRILRSASLLTRNNAASYLFVKLLPMQGILLAILLVYAIYLGIRTKKNAAEAGEKVDVNELLGMIKDTELSRPKLFVPNLILTVIIIITLMLFQQIPNYFVFAIGLVIGMMMNYPNLKQQDKLAQKYYAKLWPVTPAVLLSGVVVGVMQYSGMLDAMVKTLMAVIPTAVGPYVYLIIALFSTPLMLLFTNDTWYYALVPIVAAFSSKYGVAPEIVVATLFMNFGAMISPVAQPQIYVATELSDGMDLSTYVKYTFPKLWVLNVVWVAGGFLLGTFR